MPKLTAPLLAFKATGRLGRLFSLARRQGRNIIERRPFPTDAKSPAQLFDRTMFNKCIDLWHLLSDAEKQEWESSARPRHMTGYAWYLSQCLRPNPGIYLPLIGGTMAGEIKMALNSITELPPPTGTAHATRKAYVDATALAAANAMIAIHAAIAAAHHARYTDGEAVTAAKTVKLDDFATPNDNADLDFSTLKHGLVPKGTDVGDFLKDDGTWATVVSGYIYTELYSGPHEGGNTDTWEDWDISALVPVGTVWVEVYMWCEKTGLPYTGIRKNGSALNRTLRASNTEHRASLVAICECDSNRVIEIRTADIVGRQTAYRIIGYWK